MVGEGCVCFEILVFVLVLRSGVIGRMGYSRLTVEEAFFFEDFDGVFSYLVEWCTPAFRLFSCELRGELDAFQNDVAFLCLCHWEMSVMFTAPTLQYY